MIHGPITDAPLVRRGRTRPPGRSSWPTTAQDDVEALACATVNGYWPPPRGGGVNTGDAAPARPREVAAVQARLAERQAEVQRLEAEEAGLLNGSAGT